MRTLDQDGFDIIEIGSGIYETGTILGFELNLDILGNIAPRGIAIVYYMCKAFAQINSVIFRWIWTKLGTLFVGLMQNHAFSDGSGPRLAHVFFISCKQILAWFS